MNRKQMEKKQGKSHHACNGKETKTKLRGEKRLRIDELKTCM